MPPQQGGYGDPGFAPQQPYYPPPQQPGYDASGKPLNPPYMDDNDPSYKAAGMGFDDKSIRAGFIRRVYGILSVSSATMMLEQDLIRMPFENKQKLDTPHLFKQSFHSQIIFSFSSNFLLL